MKALTKLDLGEDFMEKKSKKFKTPPALMFGYGIGNDQRSS